jgi:hypothetical protein
VAGPGLWPSAGHERGDLVGMVVVIWSQELSGKPVALAGEGVAACIRFGPALAG